MNSLKNTILYQHFNELIKIKNDDTIPVDIRDLINNVIKYFADPNNINISDVKTILYYLNNKDSNHISKLLLKMFEKNKIAYVDEFSYSEYNIIFPTIIKSRFDSPFVLRFGSIIFDIEVITENEDNIREIELNVNYCGIRFKNIKELKYAFTILNPIITINTRRQQLYVYYKNRFDNSCFNNYVRYKEVYLRYDNTLILYTMTRDYYYNFGSDLKMIKNKDHVWYVVSNN